MEIDFIKWKVGYAEGFEIEYVDNKPKRLIYRSKNTEHSIYFGSFPDSPLEPLLSQRAIEGINTEGKYKIISDEVTYTVFLKNNPELLIIAELKNGKREYDQAKIGALKYVYEQEKKS